MLDSILLLLVAIVWGTSYAIAKNAVTYYPVLGFIAIRFCLTFIILLPIIIKSKNLKITLTTGIPLGIILLLIFICETYGLSITSASNSAFLISLYIVFTPLVQWLVLKDKPSWKIIIATSVALIGAGLLSKSNPLSNNLNLGDYLIILAAILRGFMVTYTKKLTIGKKINNLALTAIQACVVGFGCLILGMIVLPKGLSLPPLNLNFWNYVFYLVIFCTIFAFFVQNFSVRRISPTQVSLLMGTEPVWGALFAFIYLGEHITTTGIIGGLMIVTSCLWASMK